MGGWVYKVTSNPVPPQWKGGFLDRGGLENGPGGVENVIEFEIPPIGGGVENVIKFSGREGDFGFSVKN